MRTLLHAIVYVFLHTLLNVLVQFANKMGLQKIIAQCNNVEDRSLLSTYRSQS
jgi:hypothetical protein